MIQPVFAFGPPHGWEWGGLIFLVILMFGADKIPKLAKGLGRSLGEFKKAKDDFEREIHTASATDETKRLADQNNPTIAPPTPAPGSTPVLNPPAAGSTRTS